MAGGEATGFIAAMQLAVERTNRDENQYPRV